MRHLLQFFKDQTLFVAVSVFAFSGSPAILHAQEINPLPFAESLSVSRGSVTPASDAGVYLNQTDACTLVTYDWGWTDCSHIDAFIVDQIPEVYATVIYRPDTSGYVPFDDWHSDEKTRVVADIETSMREGMRQQSQILGYPISFEGWTVQPTLNEDKGFLYYATKSKWGGDPTVNIDATVFDRRGYVSFLIVPNAPTMTAAEAEAVIIKVLDQYQPFVGENYAAFVAGDPVASVGAVGVLAGLAGLKYSKATGGIVAAALLFLKKAWFLLLLPFIWLKNLFTRRS